MERLKPEHLGTALSLQVVTAVDSITPSFYHHEQLAIDGLYKQVSMKYLLAVGPGCWKAGRLLALGHTARV
jgi:hypothetical protein